MRILIATLITGIFIFKCGTQVVGQDIQAWEEDFNDVLKNHVDTFDQDLKYGEGNFLLKIVEVTDSSIVFTLGYIFNLYEVSECNPRRIMEIGEYDAFVSFWPPAVEKFQVQGLREFDLTPNQLIKNYGFRVNETGLVIYEGNYLISEFSKITGKTTQSIRYSSLKHLPDKFSIYQN